MMQSYENPVARPRLVDDEDEKYMRRCLYLASCGRLLAPPNPMVGCVIVAAGRIIGEGYHVRCGTPHAEVNAIRSVRPDDRALLADSTLYVSLEPCAHFGRTPPCAALIVKTGIRRVVVGCIDPFARVSGRGIAILRDAGISVTVGVLEKECRRLNRRFITAQTLGRPFITLKWAVSADGLLDCFRSPDEAASTPPARLSTPLSSLRVHRLRAEHGAILVGYSTLTLDRPSLTVRYWSGPQPLRVVLGRVAEGELPSGFTAYADIDTMLVDLHRGGIQSLLVEGGGRTLQSFIDRGLWDEAWEELSLVRLGSGIPAPRMPLGAERTVMRRLGVTLTRWVNEVCEDGR